MSTPDTTGRTPRRKATTEEGRAILQRERQRLAREQALLGEQIANEAANKESHATVAENRSDPVTAERLGVSRGIVRRVAAVLASEGVNLPINTRPSTGRHDLRAWTDFQTIDVTYEMFDDKRLLAATLRGALYHEGGHVRWTIPWPKLTEHTVYSGNDRYFRAWNCLEDQRMETAVVSDSPRKAAYFTPMIMTIHTRTLDMAAANYPLLIWRKYLPRRLRDHARRAFIALHDAQGKPGLMLAEAFEQVTTDYVTAQDPDAMLAAVVAYHKLLELTLPLASDMSDAGHNNQRYLSYRAKPNERNDEDVLTIPISPDMLQEDFQPEQAEEVPSEEPAGPQSLDDLSPEEVAHIFEVLAASLLSAETLVTIRYSIDQPQAAEGEGEGAGSLLDEDEDEGSKGAEQDADADEQDGTDAGEVAPGRRDVEEDTADEEADGEDEGHGDADGKADESAPTPEAPGGSSGTHTDDGSDAPTPEQDKADDFDQDDLDELLQEAEEERYNQDDLSADVRAFDDHNTMDGSHLDSYIGGISTDGEAQGRADYLAEDIERAFHEQTMDKAPNWVEGQRRGMLNVLRYETRQPGETDFYRQWTEDDQPGFNIAVSVLLDYSSSMRSHEGALAECGYACKAACDRLDIPCTVTLWDTDARVLFDGTERAEYLPTIAATGSTDPSAALADLDNQRMNRPTHIVLVMTDGEWADEWTGGQRYGQRRKIRATRSLAPYKDEGRLIVGFGLGEASLAEGLLAKGCDEAFGIDSLVALPQQLERILLAYA